MHILLFACSEAETYRICQNRHIPHFYAEKKAKFQYLELLKRNFQYLPFFLTVYGKISKFSGRTTLMTS